MYKPIRPLSSPPQRTLDCPQSIDICITHKVLSSNMFLRLSSQDLPMLDDFHQRLATLNKPNLATKQGMRHMTSSTRTIFLVFFFCVKLSMCQAFSICELTFFGLSFKLFVTNFKLNHVSPLPSTYIRSWHLRSLPYSSSFCYYSSTTRSIPTTMTCPMPAGMRILTATMRHCGLISIFWSLSGRPSWLCCSSWCSQMGSINRDSSSTSSTVRLSLW